jgi:hypothetical protein
MMNPIRIAGQLGVIGAIFSAVALLSNRPVYRQTPRDTGIVMLSFVHGADRRADCRPRTAEEIAKLAPNMRRTLDCPRERRPIYVELDVGGRTIYQARLRPAGIASDGPSRVYERFVLPAGQYDIAVRMRDTPRIDGFDHQHSERVALAPDQMFVIDFRTESGKFVFH